MLKVLKALDIKKSGVFAAGVLFGTAGVKMHIHRQELL